MRRVLALAVLAGLLAVVPLGAAGAQEGLDVRIREAALDDDGRTELIVSTGGLEDGEVLPASAFSVAEQGQEVGELEVTPLLESQELPVSVVLLMDVSGSLQNQPIADAREGALAFAREIGDSAAVSLMTFATDVETVVGFTRDQGDLLAAVETLDAGGRTSLFDGVVAAAGSFGERAGVRSIVLFADGEDNESAADLDDAVAAATEARADINVAILRAAPTLDETPLRTMASETGGKAVSVDDSDQLVGVFEGIAQQIASQYVISYTAPQTGPAEMDVAVTVTAGGATVTDEIVVVNPRVASAVTPEELPAAAGAAPIVPFFGGPLGLYLGVAGVFLAVALVVGIALTSGRGRSAQLLEDSLAATEGGVPKQTVQERTGFAGTAIAAKAREIADMMPKPEGFEEELQLKIERAGWRLRASEFLILSLLVASGSALLLGVLTSSWLGGALGIALGAIAPQIAMNLRIRKRQKDFVEQMPDTLQLLSGSLRAGYGILQAMDTVVKEAPDPTGPEFARALGEARLGMPLSEALESMSNRLGSEDFRWVVLAMNIQRQVGGNLADLLETVAKTLRERAMVRRQIKALSAEGKLSAIVLVALPFLLAAYMWFVNRGYLMTLFTNIFGWIMVLMGGVLMAVGIFWIRKLIDIEV
jgi:tight adherence protein B